MIEDARSVQTPDLRPQSSAAGRTSKARREAAAPHSGSASLSGSAPPLPSDNRFSIDLGAIAHNARGIRRLVGEQTWIVAALKSNAHGFGLVGIAKALTAAGVNAIGVVSLHDALALRSNRIECPILLYPGHIADEATSGVVSRFHLMPTLLDLRSAETYSRAAAAAGPIDAFVKVDVGLQRLGLAPYAVIPFLLALRSLPGVTVRGLYTHLHVTAGDDGPAHVESQFHKFAAVCDAAKAAGFDLPIRMAASSAVLTLFRTMNLTAIDPGRLFYGLMQAGPGVAGIVFRPAFASLKSHLIQVKSPVETSFPHLSPFTIRPGMRIGVVPVGRSDGIEALTCGAVLVRGRRAPILNVSLEHARIDLSDVEDAAVGDEVVLIGRQGALSITPQDVARHCAIDPAQLAIGVRGSFAREYV
jgi:alanine racemase